MVHEMAEKIPVVHDASWQQRQKRFARERFARAQRLERDYLRRLRQVSEQINALVKGYAPRGVVFSMPQLRQMLEDYSKLLRPWAKQVASDLLSEIAKKNELAWIQHGREIGKELKKELQTAPTGVVLQQLLHEQVELITSLPLDAAERVHKMTVEALSNSGRAEEMAKEILRTGEVTKNRATLIARTEVARTASMLTQVRSQHVGSEYAIWRTSRDGNVRESHKKMEGVIFKWDDPPIVDGEPLLPGRTFNCRCWPEPLFTDE